MTRLKIVADDKIPFLKGVLESYADIIYLPGSKISNSDLADADALFIRTRTKCNRELLEGAGIKLIVTATIGFDHIDIQYCDSAGIRWVNAPGCNSASVEQYVLSAILAYVMEKRLSLPDLTIGIIGVGNVGSKVARSAGITGMKVLLNDPLRAGKEGDAGFVDLKTLLNASDIVTCHTPLSREGQYKTYHLISEDFIRMMKSDSVLINTSRGEVMETDEVEQAVHSKLSACILDVWENEPEISLSLLDSAFIGTSHIAGYSSDGKANGTSVCVKAFCEFFDLDTLKDWHPEHMPSPPMSKEIYMDGADKSKEQILFEAVMHTYPIKADSEKLKGSPHAFEKQRENYWVRREFDYYTILYKNLNPSTVESLQLLGFKTRIY